MKESNKTRLVIFFSSTLLLLLPLTLHGGELFVGIPVKGTRVNAYGESQTIDIPLEKSARLKVVISEVNNSLVWSSRENDALCGKSDFRFFNFYSIGGHGSIRIFPADMQEISNDLAILANPEEKRKVLGYVEIIYDGVGVIIYQGYSTVDSLTNSELVTIGRARCAAVDPYEDY